MLAAFLGGWGVGVGVEVDVKEGSGKRMTEESCTMKSFIKCNLHHTLRLRYHGG